ncbi:DUF397 domain-containing protein [Streptomyces flavofungini]|uniref:DUF397 domain-containing protein n=1 Tax=Streptomyces flavofungini TaxID=68200 RepID=UPI0034E02421
MNVEQPVLESTWFKSSYSSGAGGECVEVAAPTATVYVRDSKDKTRTPLAVHPTAWAAFVGFVGL